tara:strand:+ start:450 stop:557 length:108 start_codon:yes stop_codon:yes gene_type:complete
LSIIEHVNFLLKRILLDISGEVKRQGAGAAAPKEN